MFFKEDIKNIQWLNINRAFINHKSIHYSIFINRLAMTFSPSGCKNKI